VTRARIVAVLFAALALSIACTALYLVGTGGHAIHNGDEAMYAEAAREMVATGDYADLRWQGDIQLVRPPLAVWVLVLGRVFLDGEPAVRWPLAAMCGLQVALVFVLGFLWFERRWLGGLCAAGMLATADLFVGYARYVESEPVLCVAIVAAIIGWELARRRRGWVILWGVGLGAALMTKQLIGAIPLLCPLVERVASDGDRAVWRKTWLGLVAAALVWTPWHLRQTLHHGARFWSAYIGQNVVERSQTALLHVTRPTYYVRELWRAEGVFAVVFAVAVGFCVWRAVRHRRRRELSILLWVLGPLLVFTIASSRYDHYALVIYPALALAVAELAVLPLRQSLLALVAVVLVGGAFATHAWRHLSTFDGDDEIRALMRAAHNGEAVYAYNTHAYSAKYYLGDAKVSTLLESRTDFDTALGLHAAGMPASVVLATNLAATLETLPRPHWLLLPRARANLIAGISLTPTAESRHYLLLHNP